MGTKIEMVDLRVVHTHVSELTTRKQKIVIIVEN